MMHFGAFGYDRVTRMTRSKKIDTSIFFRQEEKELKTLSFLFFCGYWSPIARVLLALQIGRAHV
jgi:hypothetical protein